MDHYLDILVLPDSEFPGPILMNALFAKLHRALVQLQSDSIGVSFPGVEPKRRNLGRRLRLHGPAADLDRLMAQGWLKGMLDHIEMGELKAVPADAKHCQVRRVQSKSNAPRLRRRYLKRHPEVGEEEARNRIPDSVERQLQLPFIRLKSASTGQEFCLFLDHRSVLEQPIPGTFNTYGLSAEASIPWF